MLLSVCHNMQAPALDTSEHVPVPAVPTVTPAAAVHQPQVYYAQAHFDTLSHFSPMLCCECYGMQAPAVDATATATAAAVATPAAPVQKPRVYYAQLYLNTSSHYCPMLPLH